MWTIYTLIFLSAWLGCFLLFNSTFLHFCASTSSSLPTVSRSRARYFLLNAERQNTGTHKKEANGKKHKCCKWMRWDYASPRPNNTHFLWLWNGWIKSAKMKNHKTAQKLIEMFHFKATLIFNNNLWPFLLSMWSSIRKNWSESVGRARHHTFKHKTLYIKQSERMCCLTCDNWFGHIHHSLYVFFFVFV